MTRVSPKALLRLALWVWLLSAVTACGGAYERAEDATCARVREDIPLMSPGPVKDAAMVVDLVCVADEAAEKKPDGGK